MIVVVDTSAIVAILQDEPETLPFTKLMAEHEISMSTGSLIETLRVIRVRRTEGGVSRVWAMIEAQGITLVAPDQEQVALADEGMRRFGKGRGEPPAVLNFGDLFAYALARHLRAPLLFKGNDFSRTDISPALTA